MLRYLPLILAFVVIGAAAVYDGVINHRWTRNVDAERCAQLLESVPAEIGPWQGESYEVDEEILRVAGATGYVSRAYVNEETDEVVKVWLIVGPFKHVIRHTPDICYPSQDFSRQAPIETYEFSVDDDSSNQFLTSVFSKSGQAERVFWSWHRPAEASTIDWYAGGKRENRERYAGTAALFKLYFTTVSPSVDTPPGDSPAVDFAKDFLPVLNDLIRNQRGDAAGPAIEEPASSTETPLVDDA